MLKVALTGPHGVGKTYIIDQVCERLREEGYRVLKVPSLTRKLAEVGYSINEENEKELWLTQLICATQRDFEEKRLAKEGEEYKADVLLSDRWVFDEYIYTKYFAKKSQSSESYRLNVVLTPIFYLVQNAYSFWDILKIKMPHPDHKLEADGHRDVSDSFHEGITKEFEKSTPYSMMSRLSLDRDEAADELFEEILSCLQK